jgi:glycine/D-amino acid oxidase-like deaminating enzyme
MRVRSEIPEGTHGDPLAPLAEAPADARVEARACDVLVVGAGPGGLSAALAAARAGLRVLVLDERGDPGGQYFKPLGSAQRFVADHPTDRQFARGRALTAAARAAGVEILNDAIVWAAFAPDEIGAIVGGRALVVRPRRLILAPGAYERSVPIPGWTLPGVMTTGALQTLARTQRVSPGRRVVIAGNGPLNLQTAVELLDGGVEVAAVVESAPRPSARAWRDAMTLALRAPDLAWDGVRYLARLRHADVPVMWNCHAVEIVAEDERRRLVVAAGDGTGRREITADAVALGYGFVPSTELARQLGCAHRPVERHVGYLATTTDEDGATDVAGVLAVGDGADIGGARVAAARGTLAGLRAAAELGRSPPEAAVEAGQARAGLARALSFQAALWSLYAAPPLRPQAIDDRAIVCRCEEVEAGRLRALIAEGHDTPGALKRLTRAGMGRCQGRYCVGTLGLLIGAATDRPRDAFGWFAPRAPAKPVPAAALALEKPEWGGHRRVVPPSLPGAHAARDEGERETEVLVIGGGALGSCMAWHLARDGRDVLQVERDRLNMQASGANAGSLHVQLLSFDFGAKAQEGGGPAAATLPLGPDAVRLWQEVERASGADLEIRITGGLMLAESERDLRFLEAKVAIERRHGIESAVIGANELRALAPHLSERLVGAELCPMEGKINPLAATFAVADLARRAGARLLEMAEVTAIARERAGFRVETTRGAIRCGRIVNAAGAWSPRLAEMVGVDLPVHGAPLQMIVTESAPKLVDHLVAHADRHLSLKQAATGGLIIGGGWPARLDERTRATHVERSSIEGNLWVARRVLPALDGLRVVRAWAGMNVNIDGAPILGEVPGVPGFFHAVTSNGYTLAPIVTRHVAEIIRTGRTDAALKPYLIDRFG